LKRSLAAAATVAAMFASMTTNGVASTDGGAGGKIECRMQVPSQVRAGSPVPLTFELVSRSRDRLRILTWNTPLEGWFGRYLRVTAGGADIPYRGPQVKRGAPDPGDYVILRPGKRLRAVVDLTQVYALGAPGGYRVAFEGWLHDVTEALPAGKRTPYQLRCPEVAVTVIPG
jgi:peptidyl-Lys metalloendopeptidase